MSRTKREERREEKKKLTFFHLLKQKNNMAALSDNQWNAKRRGEGSPTSVLSFRRLTASAAEAVGAAEAAEAAEAPSEQTVPTSTSMTVSATVPATTTPDVFALLDSAWYDFFLLLLLSRWDNESLSSIDVQCGSIEGVESSWAAQRKRIDF